MGTNLRIPVKVSGIPKPTSNWVKGNKSMKSHGRINLETFDSVTTLLIKKVTREDDGMYTLKAVNDVGEDKATFDVEVIGEYLILRVILLYLCLLYLQNQIKVKKSNIVKDLMNFRYISSFEKYFYIVIFSYISLIVD